MIVALGYLRVSSDKQRERVTIDSQRRDVPAYIAAQGWTLGGLFEDDGRTALAARDERIAALEVERDDAIAKGLGWQEQCRAERAAVEPVHLLLMDPAHPLESLHDAAKRAKERIAALEAGLREARSRTALLREMVETRAEGWEAGPRRSGRWSTAAEALRMTLAEFDCHETAGCADCRALADVGKAGA